MKLFYIYPCDLLRKDAKEISILNTFYELKSVSNAKLVINSIEESIDNLNDFYQIELCKSDFIKNDKKSLFSKKQKPFTSVLKDLIYRYDEDGVFYTRDLECAKFIIDNKTPDQLLFFELNYIEHKDDENLESVLLNADGVICENNSAKCALQEKFENKIKNIKVIYSSIQSTRRVKIKNFKKDEIAYFGSFKERNGLGFLSEVLRDFFSLKFYIYGDSNSDDAIKFKSLIMDESYYSRLYFMGFIHQREVLSTLYYNEKILLIGDQIDECNRFSLPIKLFEYLSSCNVVIAPNYEPFREIIKSGKNGFLYKGGDIDDLKRVLGNVLMLSQEELNEVAKYGIDSMKNFTYKLRAKNLIKFIYDVKTSRK